MNSNQQFYQQHYNGSQYNNEEQPNKTIPVISLISGIISILFSFSISFSFIAGLIGLALGISGIKKKNSKGLCITGIVLSILGIIITFTILLLFIYFMKHSDRMADTFVNIIVPVLDEKAGN